MSMSEHEEKRGIRGDRESTDVNTFSFDSDATQSDDKQPTSIYCSIDVTDRASADSLLRRSIDRILDETIPSVLIELLERVTRRDK